MNDRHYQAIVVDTETTGFKEPEVIQLAWADPDNGQVWTNLYRPTKPIELGALAACHILPSDLRHCEPSSEAIGMLPSCDYVIGHNVDYDADVLGGMAGVKRICTLAMARHHWPQLDSHKLSALAYHTMGVNDDTRQFLRGAHDAKVDVLICITVLDEIARQRGLMKDATTFDWSAVYEYSEIARVPTEMTFGKHKGEPIKDLPKSYVDWFLKQSDVDPYLRRALEAAR